MLSWLERKLIITERISIIWTQKQTLTTLFLSWAVLEHGLYKKRGPKRTLFRRLHFYYSLYRKRIIPNTTDIVWEALDKVIWQNCSLNLDQKSLFLFQSTQVWFSSLHTRVDSKLAVFYLKKRSPFCHWLLNFSDLLTKKNCLKSRRKRSFRTSGFFMERWVFEGVPREREGRKWNTKVEHEERKEENRADKDVKVSQEQWCLWGNVLLLLYVWQIWRPFTLTIINYTKLKKNQVHYIRFSFLRIINPLC